MAFIPSSGSVVAFQSDPSKLQASITGTVTALQGGTRITSIAGVVNVAGSVVAMQGTNPWIITGSVQASLTPAANQSVSGTVGASVIGVVPITQSGTMISSISGLVNIAGSVAGFLNSTNASVITVAQSSVAVAIVSGSIAATFTPPANQSVSGTVGASVIGTVPVTQSGLMITSIAGIPNINIASIGGAGASADAGNTNPGTLRVVQATASSFNTGQVTVPSITAASLIAANANRIKITFINNGTNPVYLGSNATTLLTLGQYMPGVAGYPIIIRSSASIFGIASVAQTISYLEEIK
jgi:hypothetical protein